MDTTVPTDENVQMLLLMGFPSESEIRRALKIAKSDINEAVDMLTNGQQLTSLDDLSNSATNYADGSGTMEVTDTSDFPAANFYELESRVYTDSWSIPYREDESLAKCMFAAIKLLKEGKAGNDELCSKFLNQCLPESFKKLLNSQAIFRWSSEIQEGVYDMMLILMDLVSTALTLPAEGEDSYVPTILLDILALSFSPDCVYHQKNKSMRTKCEYWEDKIGQERVMCYPHKSHLGSREFSWLSNLVNRFQYSQGLEKIVSIIELPKTNITAMAALMEPLAACVQFLVVGLARPMLEKSIKRILHTIEHR
ncbi:ubiquitin carboxyl-terminal hydrolase 24-like [Watersipora subatra]|uniref:ubiquitin carboxyl-terminal hydrolase 24-like n=1 Tax=Watersipora subatra TaxID=2589382 RepID=UPI00355BF408